MPKRFKAPKLLEKNDVGELQAYNSDDVYAEMRRIDLHKEWFDWFAGSTGVIGSLTGKFGIYKHDVDSFLAGGPNLD